MKFFLPESEESDEEIGEKVDLGTGKSFTEQEDELIKKSVLEYIDNHALGDLVMNCKSHKQTRNCLKEITAAKYQEKHGNEWRNFSDAMGKHMNHVKDAWRRIGLTSKKKGLWTMEEYQILFDLVNKHLRMKGFKEKNSKHGMILDKHPLDGDKLPTWNKGPCRLPH